jgi:hypothetical protein
MTRKLLILFILFLGSQQLQAQNIYWALHLNDNTEYKKAKPKKIIETGTYNITTQPRNTRSIVLFDDAGRILSREYNNLEDKYTVTTRFVYDTVRNIVLSCSEESKSHIRTLTNTTHFEYDSNLHLVRIFYRDESNKLIRITQITNNEKGHPVQLVELDSNGVQILMETAVYNYEKNRVAMSVFSKDGKEYSSSALRIDRTIASQVPEVYEKYNEQGDLIAYQGKISDGTTLPFEVDIIYDEKGNWKERKHYEIISPYGKKERVLSSVYRREYFY